MNSNSLKKKPNCDKNPLLRKKRRQHFRRNKFLILMNLVEGYAYSASKVMINNKKCKLGRTAPENYAHE